MIRSSYDNFYVFTMSHTFFNLYTFSIIRCMLFLGIYLSSYKNINLFLHGCNIRPKRVKHYLLLFKVYKQKYLQYYKKKFHRNEL